MSLLFFLAIPLAALFVAGLIHDRRARRRGRRTKGVRYMVRHTRSARLGVKAQERTPANSPFWPGQP
jgi:hypothetical protein